MNKHSNKYLRRIENLGFGNFVQYTYHQKLRIRRSGTFLLGSKHAKYPLICRAGTSDIDVFKHIFVLREYSEIDWIKEPTLIVDCGANAGFSTAYFLNRYPQATVVAVEPDSENFKSLENNVAPYGNRSILKRAGIWSKECGLCVENANFGDGREWARSVREAKPGETPDVQAIGIDQILAEAPFDRISILKIDIEGSENEVFARGDLEWLEKVDCIVIELHGDECTRTYLDAVDRAGFKSEESGGLMVSTRKKD